ncbi:MAG: class I SAM-dependent rRNA methyltransferase, partial [Bryobacteraceae bacterium]|nr:class I SAM-dependent rRNA methyltransferase [Bryobacteraceae bacterium]
MKQVRVNRKAAGRVADGHPWIFQSDVLDTGGAAPGDAVRVADPANKLLGVAHFSEASQITLRMLDTKPADIGPDFFRARIRAAQAHRDRVVRDTNAYRLVHAEADRLPALIIDRYADCFVVQTQNQGMDRAKDEILAVLEELYSPRAIVLRNDASVRKLERLPLEKSVARGALPEILEIEMNGLTLRADLLEGQKTGVFLDQRENYAAA